MGVAIQIATRKIPSMFKNISNFNYLGINAFVEHWAASLPNNSKVLDVGAGPCRFRHLFSNCEYRSQDFCQHTGIAEGPMADMGEWRYGKIDYVSDATDIPVPDASFDAIFCTEVIEHVLEPIKVIRELSRILRPGGRLLITAPLGSGLHQEPHHFYGGYTKYWYQHFLALNGFENISITPNGGFFKYYGQESRRFSAMLNPRNAKGLLAKIAIAPFWLASIPMFRIALPIACHYFDHTDVDPKFTVGYLVTAVRNSANTAD